MWTNIGILILVIVSIYAQTDDDKSSYNQINEDGTFKFGHSNDDEGGHYHIATGLADEIVRGRYGSKNAETGNIDETVYTAGPRGFRARGPTIHRKMDLSQYPVGPIGTPDDPNADPREDPSYSFKYQTVDAERQENKDSYGRVKGLYSYIDDVGESHTVRYAASAENGFEVLNAVPDLPAFVNYNAPLYKAPSDARGRMAVQRGTDGQYRFILSGPDQRRSETSGPDGIVRGQYSYLDDQGVQRTIHYIAGAGIGYRVVQSLTGVGSHLASRPAVPELGIPDREPNDFDDGYPDKLEAGRPIPNVPPPAYGQNFLPNRNKIDQTNKYGVGGDRVKPGKPGVGDRFSPTYSPVGGRPTLGVKGREPIDKKKPGYRGSDDRTPNRGGGADAYGQDRDRDYLSGGYDSSKKPVERPGFPTGGLGGSTRQPDRGGSGSRFGDGNRKNNRDDLSAFDKNRPSTGLDRRPTQPGYRGEPGRDRTDRNRGDNSIPGGSRNKDDRFSSNYPDRNGKPEYPRGGSPSTDFSSNGNSKPTFGGGSSPGSIPGGRRPDDGGFDDRRGDYPPRGRPPTREPFSGSRFDIKRPRPPTSYEYANDFSGSSSNGRDHHPNRPGVIDLDRGGDTLIRNVGDETFELPPGSHVRAHVQNIDILPIGRTPSPSEALRRDELKEICCKKKLEQLNS